MIRELHVSSGILEFWYLLEGFCFSAPRDSKPGELSLYSASPIDHTLHTLSQLIAGEIKCVLCHSTGRGHLEACSWFPLVFAPCAFPFADVAVYRFIVIDLSHEYNYMQSLRALLRNH